MDSYSEMKRITLADVESISKIYNINLLLHKLTHKRCILRRKMQSLQITSSQRLTIFKAGKAACCDEIRPEMLET